MLQPGQTIGGYRIDALLGKGAMGEVYQGEQLSLGRPVAIKRIADHLLDEGDALTRFEREAKCVAALADPHIIAVYDFGLFTDADGQGQVLLIMELVPGGRSLKQLMQPDQPLSWQEATALILQAARGLMTAHEAGVVHRDIKPDNMLLSVKGLAKIADFGLARGSESTALTAAGNMLGTPNYMSPEACQGESVGPAGDIYSLGASWYHLVAGRPPYQEANLMALVHAHCEKQPQPITELVPQLPVQLGALIARCMAKQPAQRPSAEELVQAINAAAGALLPADLRDLCRRGGMATDPSTLPTTVDPNARTVRSDESATAETLPSPTAETALPAAAEQPPEAGPAAPPSRSDLAPKGVFFAVVILVVAIVIGAIAFGRDPLEDCSEQVDFLLGNNEISVALTTVDDYIRQHPSDPRGHALAMRVVRAEVDELIEAGMFDDAQAMVKRRQAERDWLDTTSYERDIELGRAAMAVDRQRAGEAETILRQLMERMPQDQELRRRIVSMLADPKAVGAWRTRNWAAWELVELAGPAGCDATVLDVVLDNAFDRNASDDYAGEVRQALLAHHREATIARARQELDHEREQHRRNALFFLREATVLTPEEELRYHLRNVIELSGSNRRYLDEAKSYLSAQLDQPDWHQRLAAAGFERIEDCRALDSWSDWHSSMIGTCAAALGPELRPWALRMIALGGDDARRMERQRWNALRFLEQSGGLDGIDLDAFHAATLVSFEPWYRSQPFVSARDHFGAQLDGPQATKARAALEAAQRYILEVRERVVANNNSTDVIDENLASIDVLLK